MPPPPPPTMTISFNTGAAEIARTNAAQLARVPRSGTLFLIF